MSLGVWSLRAALLAILVSIPLRMMQDDADNRGLLLERTRIAFERAGYRVDQVTRKKWGDQTQATETALVARARQCPADVTITGNLISDLIDPASIQDRAVAPIFAFGEWSGPMPSRQILLAEGIRLRLRHAFAHGQSPRANSTMLVIQDPSACMAIAEPDLPQIWQ